MKITCQACQAKYTIADEKVVGKVVKIRCKKCGASIVVNGTESAGAASVPPGAPVEDVKPADQGAAWTVNVADGDQRTMTEAEIVQGYKTGVVNDDTFCWREGMTDWLSLQEIAPLHAACTKGRSPVPASSEDELPTVIHDTSAALGAIAAAPRPTARRADHAAPKEGNGNGATIGAPPAATVAARRAGGRGAAADLFGGAARAGGEDEVMTSAPAEVPQPHPDGQKATGARNENSVLFALQGKGEGPPPPAAAMAATNEASGLIDIRQLSAQMHSSAEKKERNARVDDIMNLGAAGGLSPGLSAPLLSAPSLEHYSQPPPSLLSSMGGAAEAKNKALVFLALGAGTFFLVAAIGIAVLLFRGGGKESTASDQEKTAASGTASAAAKPSASVASASASGETPQASAAPAQEAPSASAGESAGASKEAKELPAKETAVAPPAAPKAVPFAAAAAKEAAPAPVAAPAAEFNMGEARSRLAAVAGGVQTCKRGDSTGSGRVEIVFAPSGAVQSANLMAGSPFDGSPTGKCVEARFRGARVPAFGGSPFTVTKSFSIN